MTPRLLLRVGGLTLIVVALAWALFVALPRRYPPPMARTPVASSTARCAAAHERATATIGTRATTLSARDRRERRQAEAAMRGIGHVNTSYAYWFGSEKAFRKRLPDLFFIGFTDRLDGDFEALRSLGRRIARATLKELAAVI